MGRARRKYKELPVYVADNSAVKKIKVEIDDKETQKYDEANALVLPSKKRKTREIKPKTAAPVKLLSKKKRKELERIVDIRRKKAIRSSLLEALQEVQGDQKTLKHLTQLQSTQTLGRKKFKSKDYALLTKEEVEEEGGSVVSAVRGRKRKRKEALDKLKTSDDPNVVQLGEMSSSDESDDEEMEEEEENVDQKEENMEQEEVKVNGELDKEESSKTGETKEETAKVSEDESEKQDKDKEEGKEAEAVAAEFINVKRSQEVQEARLKLPILAEEQAVMEKINGNQVTVIVGATGSGKTTQVPQFLYETGYTRDGMMIGITEPRRVAAISMSQRVAHELNLTSKEVSYQIRFEGNSTPDTKIKFMTDGVLLKEIQMDPTLKKYSVIIIDEAHERSVFSDILIGILSRILPIRAARGKPLKVIIMSATLRVEDFTENQRLFRKLEPPVIKVEARMFDVTIHYNKKTKSDYMAEAYRKACKIHRQLPDGGILIFLTGQQEVLTLVRKLRATFPMNTKDEATPMKSAFQRKKDEKRAKKDEKKTIKMQKRVLPSVKLEDFVSAFPDDAEGEIDDNVLEMDNRGVVDHDSDLDFNDDDMDDVEIQRDEPEQPMWVLPMYSMLPPEKQRLIFHPPPEGTRLCVVATNVAETSLTIPNIKYVIDSGKVKEKVYDKVTGVSMFHVTWTSQASANQRAGRAGRTAPGHCYRLYSSAIFNDEFQSFSTPEMLRRPIDDLVLIMKSMNLPVVNFPFPTPPEHIQILSGIRRLIILGGLDQIEGGVPLSIVKKKGQKDLSYVTPLGKAMAAFPLAPRYGKMLALSHQHNLLPYTVALVAALTVHEVLIETPLDHVTDGSTLRKKWQNVRLSWAGEANSRSLGDPMILLRAVGAAEYQGANKEWCEKNGLRHKAIVEIRKLRRQLTNEINLIIPSCNLVLDPKMKPPTDTEAKMLRQIMLAGAVDHVARRVDDFELREKDTAEKAKWKYAYRTQEMEDPVFLPTSSVVRIDMPKWVVYQEIYEKHKMFMRHVTVIEPEWLAVFAPKLCTFSPPMEKPEPRYDSEMDKIVCHRTATFGPSAWEIPEVEVEYPHGVNLFRWVAFQFLVGNICPNLKPFTEYLHDPRTLVNEVAIRYQTQRKNMLRALMSQNITNYAKLEEVWSEHPTYLQKEYLEWISDSDIKPQVISIWPPLLTKESHGWD